MSRVAQTAPLGAFFMFESFRLEPCLGSQNGRIAVLRRAFYARPEGARHRDVPSQLLVGPLKINKLQSSLSAFQVRVEYVSKKLS